MEMEMDISTRSANYIFISFRWKITVIYCFVVCPLNEWFFLYSKIRRRFGGVGFFLLLVWFGPVTVYVSHELLHVSTNKFQNEITVYCIISWKKNSWQVHKAKRNIDTNVLKGLPKIMTTEQRNIHNCTTPNEPKTEKKYQLISILFFFSLAFFSMVEFSGFFVCKWHWHRIDKLTDIRKRREMSICFFVNDDNFTIHWKRWTMNDRRTGELLTFCHCACCCVCVCCRLRHHHRIAEMVALNHLTFSNFHGINPRKLAIYLTSWMISHNLCAQYIEMCFCGSLMLSRIITSNS